MKRIKYTVSLAMKVPVNYEIDVYAPSEEKALEYALSRYRSHNDNDGSMTEPLWWNAELDIGNNNEGISVWESD